MPTTNPENSQKSVLFYKKKNIDRNRLLDFPKKRIEDLQLIEDLFHEKIDRNKIIESAKKRGHLRVSDHRYSWETTRNFRGRCNFIEKVAPKSCYCLRILVTRLNFFIQEHFHRTFISKKFNLTCWKPFLLNPTSAAKRRNFGSQGWV